MQQKKRYLEKIRMKMKYDNACYVEPIGIAGGFCYGGRMMLKSPYYTLARTLLIVHFLYMRKNIGFVVLSMVPVSG
ncbi:hypothetical protein GQ457_11G030050 [Hibiscus cannabinus]